MHSAHVVHSFLQCYYSYVILLNTHMQDDMATRVNTQVTDDMVSFIDSRVKHGQFENKSEYIRHLIRKDAEETKKKEITLLNKTIQEGIESGISSRSPEDIFNEARQRIAQIHKVKKAGV